MESQSAVCQTITLTRGLLKDVLHGEFADPGGARRQDLTEVSTAEAGSRGAEVRMIQDVERLRAEFTDCPSRTFTLRTNAASMFQAPGCKTLLRPTLPRSKYAIFSSC